MYEIPVARHDCGRSKQSSLVRLGPMAKTPDFHLLFIELL